MTDLHNAPKTLFEIIDGVLLQFEDANLKSDEARKRIADEICDKYYTDIEIPDEELKQSWEDFSDLDAMQVYYNENYVPLNNCELGTLAGIQFFNSSSNTYNFQTTYKAIDVLGKLQVIQGASFDIQRNDQRNVLKQRQLDFLNKTIQEYLNFYNQLKFIYITGIYSPCYAEPGWSENTWWLKSLRDAIVDSTNQSKFPYSNAVIETNPPIIAAHTTPPSIYR